MNKSIIAKFKLEKATACIGESFCYNIQFYVCPKGIHFSMCDVFGKPSELVLCINKKALKITVTQEFLIDVRNEIVYQIIDPK